jgi:glycine/D-amino acid oxidase-like deaminating enzyme
VPLPLANVLQQKIAFEDRAGAVPRTAPFSVDLDPQKLDWTDEERALLAEGDDGDWLTGPFPGGVHCRPEGGGSWVKLGWAYNRQDGVPEWVPPLDPRFPEVVLRGASALVPALKAYEGRPPRRLTHYGGYYTMTRENWPLIGPMGPPGAFMVSALSGFGTMAACAAGELCADWIAGRALPAYAAGLGLARYDDETLMTELDALQGQGIL